MLQFLYPWWLLGFPLVLLPWIWPVIRPPREKPQPFSTLFLFPEQTLRRHFQWSRKEWFLKLLRSLLILFLILLLAKPYWDAPSRVVELVVIDDTPSVKAGKLEFPGSIALGADRVFRLSELFPAADILPNYRHPDSSSGGSGSPSLSEIASRALEVIGSEKEKGELKIILYSDFQHSQYWFYPASVQPVQWEFRRPEGVIEASNIYMRNLSIRTGGLFETMLSIEVYGNAEKSGEVKVIVEQDERPVGETVSSWDGNPLTLSLLLSRDYQRRRPVEVRLLTAIPQAGFDDVLHFQESTGGQFWVGIMTSEGPEGIYRHGLHALKAALNANGAFSFLIRNPDDLKRLDPDLLLLLGDDPRRWEDLDDSKPMLFIPTRLGDWREFATKMVIPDSGGTTSRKEEEVLLPRDQWLIDWNAAPMAEEWGISSWGKGFFRSEKKGMLLLRTGISAPWGSLYQHEDFADHVRNWLKLLEKGMILRSLGTFSSGSLNQLPFLSGSRLVPGHYLLPAETLNPEQLAAEGSGTLSYSVNLPSLESKMKLMSPKELEEMQVYFDERVPRLRGEDIEGVETIKRWLLWAVLLLAFTEISFSVFRKRA